MTTRAQIEFEQWNRQRTHRIDQANDRRLEALGERLYWDTENVPDCTYQFLSGAVSIGWDIAQGLDHEPPYARPTSCERSSIS